PNAKTLARTENTSLRGLAAQAHDNANHKEGAEERHQESHAQASGKLRENADQPRPRGSAQGSQRKQESADTLGSRTIPVRKPGDVDWINGSASQAGEENSGNGCLQRGGKNHHRGSYRNQAKRANHQRSFGQRQQDQRSQAATGSKPGVEKHRRESGHI